MFLFRKPKYFFHFFIRRRVDEIYYSVGLRRLGIQIVGIYEPVFIYLFFNHNLSKTFFYFAAILGLYILTVPLGGRVMVHFGVKHNMLFSIPFLGGYYLTLFLMQRFGGLVYLAIFLSALNRTLFLPAFHADFTQLSQKEKRGKQLGILNIITIVGAVIGPIIGAVILTKFGFSILFSVAILIFITSAIPLLLTYELRGVYQESYKSAFLQIFQRGWKSKALSFMFYGTDGVLSAYVWPLFLFVLAISFDAMGIITSVALLLSLGVTFYISFLTDKKKRLDLFRIGCYWASLGWIFKAFVRTALQAFFAQSFYLVGNSLDNLPLTAYVYDTAEKNRKNIGQFIIFREMTQNLGAFFFLLSSAVFLYFSHKIYLLFLFGSISLLLARYFSIAFESNFLKKLNEVKLRIVVRVRGKR